MIDQAMRATIPPSLVTATILSLGFATFLLSRFPDLVIFGAFSMSVLLFGFVADAVVTPALFRIFHRWPRRQRGALMRAVIILLLVAVVAPARAAAEPPAAADLLARIVDSDPWGFGDAEVHARAILTDKRGTSSTLVLTSRSHRHDPPLAKSLVRISAPPDLAGAGFLQVQRRDGDDERYLFLPELKTARRVSGSLRATAFMGTETWSLTKLSSNR